MSDSAIELAGFFAGYSTTVRGRCAELSIDACVHMCIQMRIDMCIDVCIGMA